METIPEVPKCFGVFPPNIAAYFISIFGLGSGGTGLAGIVIYGLAEDSFISHFLNANPVNEGVKKLVIAVLGFTSILLFIGSGLLFIGIAFKQDRALLLSGWIIFIMCMKLVIVAIAIPGLCFFVEDLCVVKKMSSGFYTLIYIFLTVFLWLWLYFMAVIFNFLNRQL